VRIVGGKFRGRALATPAHDGLRPTSDRVRESIFNILAHGIGDFELERVRVLDLFAGTGALGLEALSRGAGYCLLVEEEPAARALIRTNVEAMGLMGATRIFRRDATALGPAGNMEPYGLAFLDPPYGKGLAEKGLAGLAEGGWLLPGAIVVVEETAASDVGLPPSFAQLDRRVYGSTQVLILRYEA
jgi:16S rRNA (guanine966-N2)-methyltransferase